MDDADTQGETGRILAIDYGRRRIGLAISDPTGTIATGLDTLTVKDGQNAVRLIAAGKERWEYTKIVVGMPLLTSGEPGEMAAEVTRFVENLRASCGVTVETLDERFSSHEAQRMLHQTGRKIKGNKASLDRLAAEILLRQYLDMNTRNTDYDDDE